MPFLRYYPEPPAVLVAQILSEAKAAARSQEPPELPARPTEHPWGEDGGLIESWFAEGDDYPHQTALGADQGGTHA